MPARPPKGVATLLSRDAVVLEAGGARVTTVSAALQDPLVPAPGSVRGPGSGLVTRGPGPVRGPGSGLGTRGPGPVRGPGSGLVTRGPGPVRGPGSGLGTRGPGPVRGSWLLRGRRALSQEPGTGSRPQSGARDMTRGSAGDTAGTGHTHGGTAETAPTNPPQKGKVIGGRFGKT